MLDAKAVQFCGAGAFVLLVILAAATPSLVTVYTA